MGLYEESSFAIEVTILGLAFLNLGLSWLTAHRGSPVVAIFSRWTRWAFLSSLLGGMVRLLELSGYGFITLWLVSAIIIFLAETTYNWLAISALSRSEHPLFPKFEENLTGDDWPTDERSIKLKDWLRAKGFTKRQALVSMLTGQVMIRVTVFENKTRTERLHVMFLPYMKGSTVACYTLVSMTADHIQIMTDNVFLPFGGFYPENWVVERHPWIRSLHGLLERHWARIDAMDKSLIPFDVEPLIQNNNDQRLVENLNREMGFLVSSGNEEEEGRLTPAGKARVWQEIWTLSYLGLPLRYH